MQKNVSYFHKIIFYRERNQHLERKLIFDREIEKSQKNKELTKLFYYVG